MLNPPSIPSAAEGIASAAKSAKAGIIGLLQMEAEARRNKEEAEAQTKKGTKATKTTAKKKMATPTISAKGKQKKKAEEDMGKFSALLDDPEVAKKDLRPLYRAIIQATGHKLSRLPSPHDPHTFVPLSSCPTAHLGLIAIARLVTEPLLFSGGWSRLRTLLKRILSKYGVESGSRVPICREGAKPELRPLAKCSGQELGDVLLALLTLQGEGKRGNEGSGGQRWGVI